MKLPEPKPMPATGRRRIKELLNRAERQEFLNFWGRRGAEFLSSFRAVRPETGFSRGHGCVRRGQFCGKSDWTRP